MVIVSCFFLFIPFVSSILWAIGFVLVLFAVVQIANVTKDRKIATSFLIAVVAALVGLIIANLFLWNQLLEIFPELAEGRYPMSATPEQSGATVRRPRE